jgi:cyclopropane-fatty-acyl-phospholipid synthase
MDGGWSSPDLVALLELAALNRDALALAAGWWRVPGQLRRTAAHRMRRNTQSQSRRNIAAHYDLSNDLYQLFLDESMTYSSAVFETPDQSLEDAQRNKYRLMAAGAGLTGGERVLEIGTGWGGFAMYAAGELGCHVTTITISQAQAELARERVRAAGLEDRVDVQLRDYRQAEGRYDAVVSVEMIEAVGARYWPTFFRVLDRAVAPQGRVGLQAIVLEHERMLATRDQYTWVHKYIFPGGALPSVRAIDETLHRHTTLRISGQQAFGPAYARTLGHWRARFDAHEDAVDAIGFDATFRRMWDFYLAYSQAGFATGYLDVVQLVLERDA